MHGLIFQLNDEIIDKDDFLTEEELYDDFVGIIADYVDGDIDRDAAISELVISLTPYGIVHDPTEQSIVFKKGFKEKFFKPRLEKLKKRIANLTLKDFIGNSNTLFLYEIKNLIEEKYGIYVYTNKCWATFDEFVREMKEGQKYYFGSAIDYHF
ncbi:MULTISPECIES: hypothetical protein [Thermoanaerobacterium]|uniref:Uncharacterized protein n=1 Tax=Thermoanaerobacterium butyriciformans TaxID=1702242 RepID=A0ABS4NAT0_9THEO|nr:hypothetical protein [Thermoanaerobacterium butyriciformans]MBP2070751.1 hypothetical protein [Thermoanaerobacterium butyriciformans]